MLIEPNACTALPNKWYSSKYKKKRHPQRMSRGKFLTFGRNRSRSAIDASIIALAYSRFSVGGMSGEALRLVALEHFDFGVEICNGLIHVWMDSRHDDGYEILHALVLDHGRLDDVVLALLLTHKPT